MSSRYFAGLKVVEISGVLAGPAAGLFFAELGAQVFKIENKRTGGDPIRKWKLPEEGEVKASAYYHSVNWGKETVVLDFGSADDLIRLHAYLQEADIALVNFKAGDAAKWKLDNTSLRLLYPQLIIGEIKGFKTSDRVAYDAVLQAETGFMSINGTALTGPLKMPVAFIDLFAGHQLKEGLLIALLNRSKHGKGALVSVTLEESAIASLANQASTWLNTGVIPQQQGSLHPVIAPYGETFCTLDKRYIVLAVGTDQQFRKLCNILAIQGVADNEEFSTNPARIVHRKKLAAILSEAFLLRSAEELMQEFAEQDVPAGLVKNMQQLFETPVAQEMILDQNEENNITSHRVRTAIFTIQTNP